GEVRRGSNGRLEISPAAAPEKAVEPSPGPANSPPPSQLQNRAAATPAVPATATPGVTAAVTRATSTPVPVHARKNPGCAEKAITCIEVVATGGGNQSNVPVTFGQPFRAGDLPAGSRLMARDAGGRSFPLQMDEESKYPDGSLRFAVLSAQLPSLDNRTTVNLFRDVGKSKETAPAVNPGNYDFKISAKLYSPQVSIITFGNRAETRQGAPFRAGEQIVLTLSGEKFTLSVTPDMAGGDFPTLTKIAERFMQLINTQSQTYRAYKQGEGGGFENLWVTTRNVPGRAFEIGFSYSGQGKMRSRNEQEFSPPRQLEASARPALDQAIKTGMGLRLSGPVMREYILKLPMLEAGTQKRHPQLTAWLHVRLYEGGRRIRTDMVMENTWTYEPQPGNLNYEIAVRQGEKVVFQHEPFTHYHHARWHKVFWQGEAPKARVLHHMPYFLASRAVWNYDLTLGIPDSILAEDANRLAKSNTGPMGYGFITPYFPTTGGRADIGPIPRWTAIYLITQDPRAEAVMLASADAAGSVPVHYRDAPTDQPVSLEAHPGLALRFGQSSPKDAMPPMKNGGTPWTPDTAHQGSFAYVPYLLTGDLYYLDEIQFWANWNMGSANPGYRDGGKGLIHPEQLRGQAWALRSIGEAARALPEHHPMKAYFQRKLADNLTWYLNRYPRNPNKQNVSPLGLVEKPDEPTVTGPWQNDFLALVVGQLAEAGDPLAQEYFRWLSRFTVGRFTHEKEGFCRPKGPAAYLKIRDQSNRLIGDWGTLFKENWPKISNCQVNMAVEGYPDAASGYAAYARAMLANAIGLDAEKAIEGYEWLKSATPAINANFAKDPTWAIVPRTDRGKR
ncbi:MAG: hypothetical protein ACM3SV_14065, partial [Betaproteobacteria bacterium]